MSDVQTNYCATHKYVWNSVLRGCPLCAGANALPAAHVDVLRKAQRYLRGDREPGSKYIIDSKELLAAIDEVLGHD